MKTEDSRCLVCEAVPAVKSEDTCEFCDMKLEELGCKDCIAMVFHNTTGGDYYNCHSWNEKIRDVNLHTCPHFDRVSRCCECVNGENKIETLLDRPLTDVTCNRKPDDVDNIICRAAGAHRCKQQVEKSIGVLPYPHSVLLLPRSCSKYKECNNGCTSFVLWKPTKIEFEEFLVEL